ncbi:MAG: polysaccharide biosynthesis/export family protein [Sedimentisphaerales bacterium]
MMCARIIKVIILLLIMVGLTGCFSSYPGDIEAFLRPRAVNVTAESYVLQPPDGIEIHCSKVPEIHLQRQQIRPDGKVSFEALGEIDAAGKTPTELTEMLKKKVAELYALPGDNPIDVRVFAYMSKVYYVLGQVFRPGPKNYTGRDTLLSALAEAQPNPMAWEERVQVIRPSEDKKVRPKIFEVNFDRMSAHGDTSKNVLLQEGDIIYVPPTVFAAIAMKIEEVIRPIARAFSGVYIMQAGPTGVGRYGYYGGGYGGY